MKNIKKLLSIVMVLAMVLALGASALAATVTLPPDAEGHNMVAYQIFTGKQLADKGEGSQQLGVTGWAPDVNGDALLAALKADTTYGSDFNECKTPMDVADVFGNTGSTSDISAAFNLWLANFMEQHKALLGAGTKFTGTSMTLADGYWVIIDETPAEDLPADPEGNNTSRSTVILEVVGNADVTVRDKIDTPTVEKKVDGVDAVVKGLNDVVTFTLTAKLPSNYADYKTYFLNFYDTMDHGLTFVDFVSVELVHGTTRTVIDSNNYTHAEDTEDPTYEGGTDITVNIPALKTAAPAAVAGDLIVVTYTAKVDADAVVRNYNDVWLEYDNDPTTKGDGETKPGHTPKDTVIVFTFEIDGNKVDSKGGPLDGAGFTLFKKGADGNFAEYREEVKAEKNAENQNVFDFNQLGPGEYKLEETTVPSGYNKCDDIYFMVEETKDEDGTVTGAIVKQQDPKTGEWSELTSAKIVFTEDANSTEGHIPEKVTNNTGMELPETGGIGTTIFYVVGAILVAGAVILLVTRKRANDATK